jgi:CelD/BcsL family acetyltransferase involved in cellulose biosynthesis
LCIEKGRGFRTLRFIAEDRSDYLGFLGEDQNIDLEHRLLNHVLTTSSEWDVAVLRQLSEPYTRLHAIRFPSAFHSHLIEWARAPYCASKSDWDLFELEGPSWLKRTRKRLRRFLKDGWDIECLTGHEAASKLHLVSEIEARSWKAREGAVRLQPGGGQDVLRDTLQQGVGEQMELWLASIDGKAVAFQIDFVLPDCLWVYQQAYDEDYKRTSVGSFMAYISFEAAWRRGIREYDYLSGEEPYKLERTNASRAINYVAFHPRTLRGWLAYGLLVAPRWKLRNVGVARAIYKSLQSLKRRPTARPDA